jgi:very-short-patch-repair endonuclease
MKTIVDHVLKKYNYLKEYKFHPERKWRFDFALIDHKIAIEIEGGTWTGGRHVRAAGYRNDCEKYNEAVKLGWRVLRYTSDMIGENILDDIKNIISTGGMK